MAIPISRTRASEADRPQQTVGKSLPQFLGLPIIERAIASTAIKAGDES
ncbi:MAG TPA: hypothetical protein VF182_03835 [Candidatus Binatia bacterium]